MGVQTTALNVLAWHPWCLKPMLAAERSRLAISTSMYMHTNAHAS